MTIAVIPSEVALKTLNIKNVVETGILRRVRMSKARAVLKWTPEWKFEDGLRPLVEWFEKEAR